jgi:hypothetical protein
VSSITLNGLRVVSLRVVHPWRGVPFVDVDLDPDIAATAPSSGPVVILVGTPPAPPVVTLTGVIDPLAAGVFVATARARVVAGKGGWSKTVPAQHFSNPSGALLSTEVYSATAALVLEEVVDVVPKLLGTDYARSNGRASRIFDRVDWWVDLTTGVTTVAPTRPPAIPDLSLEILSFDPLTQVAELTCDTLILPGTLLVDPLRLGPAPLTVRSVEQVFGPSGSHAKAWCSTHTVERLQSALRTMVQEFGEAVGTRLYRYRFVAPMGTNQAALQAVDRDPVTGLPASMPDLIPCAEWSGVAGCTALLPPSLEVLVQFIDGDPSLPRVVGYSTLAVPLTLTLDAKLQVNVGPTATATVLGAPAAATPLARAPYVAGIASALAELGAALGSATSFPQVAAAGSALTAALGALPPPATLTTKAA